MNQIKLLFNYFDFALLIRFYEDIKQRHQFKFLTSIFYIL